MAPDISIITPWMDHPEFIEDYEKAVRDPGVQVIVVDNGSGPEQAALISAMVGRLGGTYIRNEENFWFAAANNQGLAMAAGRILMFMNNDIAADSGWLDDVRRDVMTNALMGPEVKQTKVDQTIIEYLEGWCIAGPREVWQKLGGWNARNFKMPYWEDAELCMRAIRAGIRVSQKKWRVLHKKNGTSSYVPGVLCGVEHNRQVITSMVHGQSFVDHSGSGSVNTQRIEPLEAYMESGRLPEAEHAYHQAVAREPGRAELWGIYGQVLRACGRFDAAIDAMRRAMAINPAFSVDAYHEMGLSYLNSKRAAQAAEAFREVVRLRPGASAAWVNLAIANCLSDRFEDAASAARSAITHNPRNIEGYVQLSNALLRLGNHADSRAAAKSAVRTDPNAASGYHALGVVLLAEDRPAEALTALERAEALDAHNWDVHTLLEKTRARLRPT